MTERVTISVRQRKTRNTISVHALQYISKFTGKIPPNNLRDNKIAGNGEANAGNHYKHPFREATGLRCQSLPTVIVVYGD